MKIIEYTLASDGSVPAYVVDGGYFPVANDNEPPRDLTLIGVANDDAPGIAFSSQQSLTDHLAEIGATWVLTDPVTRATVPFDPTAAATQLWARIY